MIKNTPKIRNNSYLFFSFIYALLFILIPWESMFPLGEFIDRSVYLRMMDDYNNGLNLHVLNEPSVIDWVTYELGWLYLLLFSLNLGLHPELTLTFISLFIVFNCVYTSLYFSSPKIGGQYFILVSFFFLNPIFVDFVMSQLRSAFCLALFFTFLRLNNKKSYGVFRYCILIIIPIIHTIGVLFIAFYILYSCYNDRLKNSPLRVAFVGFLVSMVMGVGWYFVLSSIGDRRAEYPDMSSSVLYMFFWIIFFIYILIKSRTVNIFTAFSFFTLSVSVFNLIFGAYSLRFLAFSLSGLFSSITSHKLDFSFSLLTFAYFSNCILQWYFWFGFSFKDL